MVKPIALLFYIASAWVLIDANNLAIQMASLSKYRISPKDYQELIKLKSLALDFSNHYRNVTLLEQIIPRDSSLDDSSPDGQCLADMSHVMDGLSSGSLWSYRMFDSWGSIPSGLLYLNLVDMGNYKECIWIKKEIDDQHTLKGQYCFVEYPIVSIIYFKLSFRMGVCFPASCTSTQIDALLNQVIGVLLNTTTTMQLVNSESCRTSDREPFDGLTIFTIVILSIFGGLAVLATLWDYFVCQDQKQLHPVVKIFSIRATSRALFRITEYTSNPNIISCLNGMRCMSLIWIVFGHQFGLGILSPNMNTLTVYYWFDETFVNLISHSVFSVDTFFFLSGLLVAMTVLRAIQKTNGKINVPVMYLHRILRLTPLLAVAILIFFKLMPLLMDGPLVDTGFEDYRVCARTWFWTLLYIQNYATDEICVPHTWYLSVDMQLYIISPIILLALYKWGKKAVITIIVIIILLSIWLFTVMMVKEYSMFPRDVNKFKDSQRVIYYYTHLHAAPWLIGALFGYFLHIHRGKLFNLSRLKVWTGWLICLAIMLVCVPPFSYTNWLRPDIPLITDAIYYTLTRAAWPVALCWVVFACMQGNGGMANSFLSHPIWQPLSKLSYSVYLFHLFVQELNIRRLQTNSYFSNYDMMLKFWSTFGFTLLISYTLHITIEAPLAGLENMLLKRSKSQKPVDSVAPAGNPQTDRIVVSSLDVEATTNTSNISQ